MSSNTTNKATESMSLTVFFCLIKLAFAAYFIYHFIGWLSL